MEQGRIMEAEELTVRVGATQTGPTVPLPPQPPKVFTGRMPFLPPTNSLKALKFNNVLRNCL